MSGECAEGKVTTYRQSGSGFPTDLPDAQWARLEPLIPASKPGGGPRKTDIRAAMSALFYTHARRGRTFDNRIQRPLGLGPDLRYPPSPPNRKPSRSFRP